MVLKKLLVSVLIVSSSLIQAQSIQDKISGVLTRVHSTTNYSVLVYNPLTRDTVYKINNTVPLIPASNTKLYSTAAALSYMGGEFSLSTKLLSDDKNLSDGVVNGNIYLKGYGNSIFSESDMDLMASELRKKGIYKVTGSIIGDDTYFDNVYTRDDWIDDEVSNVNLPPISALVVDRNRKVVTQKIRRRVRSVLVEIDDPSLNAAGKFKDKLISNGITVLGVINKGKAPNNVVPLTEANIKLRDLVKLINKNSDNFLAECLFKTIGAVVSGVEGNAFYATQALKTFLDENAIYSQGTNLVDGSGISRFDLTTTNSIVSLLEKMYFDLANFEDYHSSLSIAGVDGTLRHRLRGTLAENKFCGKTGTLNGVTSLSGYLTKNNNEDLIISMIFQFTQGGNGYYKDIEDEIITLLAQSN
ncbi:MAG TPA: D-alanyl-D-alanine carboxypeptidase/D-alanyl-D-alanine-endopeptidase [Ignavibacteriaceae bacterium]|nr:D-alanyl-D-alanine carboxypeptidase/D-alanyl-D-alanine-endopeptidase [Ignavibacteriaceae bacterium]